MNDFAARIYEPDDEVEIVGLLQKCFPDWEKLVQPVDYWRWKYLKTPHKSQVILIHSEGKLVGCAHDIIFSVKVGNSIHTCVLGDDLATHPEYRGRGVFKAIAASNNVSDSTKIAKFRYMITTNPIVINSSIMRTEKLFPHNISHLARVNDIGLHFKNKDIENKELVETALKLIKVQKMSLNALSLRRTTPKDYEVVEVKGVGEEMDTFWEKISNVYDYTLVRDRNFLNWRYSDPRFRYLTKIAIKNGQPLGYIAIEIHGENTYTKAYITDLIASPGMKDVAESLLADACRTLDNIGVNAVFSKLVKGSEYEPIFTGNGFIDWSRTSKMNIIITSFDGGATYNEIESAKSKRVYFTSGDYL